MAKKKSPILGIIGILILLIILGIIFTVDDLTGVGQIIDPLEYALIGIIGYYVGKKGM